MAIKKKVDNTARNVGIGGAITAAALAAAAGAYLLADKKTKTKAKAWVSKAKVEVAKHAKTAKKLGEKEYNAFVEQAVKKYGSLENITAGDVMKAAKDLKGDWKRIQEHAHTFAKHAKSAPAKKTAVHKKPAARKATSKAKPAAKKSRI
jgi:hypothetical protein